MVFHAAFPEKELAKEKEVVLDEINSYKDNPQEQIFDDFENLLFAGSPIGRPTLGTPESLEKMSQRQLAAFTQRYYRCSQMVFSSVGKIAPARMETLVERHFGNFKQVDTVMHDRTQPAAYKPFHKEEEKNTFQANCIIGNRAYPLNDQRRIGLAVLINYLGGPASNSRLNTLLREKNGLVYTIDATYTPYSDTGAMTIYFGCDKENIARCIALVQKELHTISRQTFSLIQLHRIKKQLLGQLVIASENGESQMLSQGKSLMAYNKVESLTELQARINAVSVSDLLAIANEIFAPDSLSMLIYK
jgi:predicted Zn-dependent peptidase